MRGKSKKRSLPGAEAGLTLIEVIVVVVIIGVLATVATLGFNRAIAHWELVTAARTMVSDLRSARDLAMTEGVQTRVYVDKTTYPVWYRVYRWHETDWEEKKSVKFSAHIHLPDQFINSHGETKDCEYDFRFSSSGNAVVTYSGTAKLENTVGESRYVVVYANTGRVRVSENPP
ncbi:MAG: prepilin-type N-terminal cleavage/methylation domain-containing protein [Bacillota bacterium]